MATTVRIAIVALVVAACGGSAGSSTTTAPSGAPTTIAAAPEEALRNALDLFRSVDAYRFSGTVIAVYGMNTTTQVEIEGWVDGDDRELVLRVAGAETMVRVIDGEATITQDGVVVEVPLARAQEAPSVEPLASLESPAFTASAEITGTLDATVLEVSDFEVTGVADAVVRVGGPLGVSGYTIVARGGGWTIDVSLLPFEG